MAQLWHATTTDAHAGQLFHDPHMSHMAMLAGIGNGGERMRANGIDALLSLPAPDDAVVVNRHEKKERGVRKQPARAGGGLPAVGPARQVCACRSCTTCAIARNAANSTSRD